MAKIIHKKAFFFRYAQKSAKKLIVLLYLAYIGLIDWIKKGPKFHGMFPLSYEWFFETLESLVYINFLFVKISKQ